MLEGDSEEFLVDCVLIAAVLVGVPLLCRLVREYLGPLAVVIHQGQFLGRSGGPIPACDSSAVPSRL